MALYETLIEGGHEHLIDAVKARIAQKADAIVEDELKPIIENQPSTTLEGELLMADDVADLPPVIVGVDGRSTQVTTTGKNLFDKDTSNTGYYDGTDGSPHASSATKWASIPVVEGDVIRWANMTNNYPSGWSNGTFVQLAASRPSSPITVPAGVDEVRVYATNPTSDSIVTKNNADLTPEPYSGGEPSPRPDWPQPIESVDELTLAFAVKNLLDTTVWAENKYIGPSGQTGSENGQHYTENYSAVLPGTYCLSMLRGTGGRIRLHGYDGSKHWVRQLKEETLNAGSSYYSTALTIPDGIAYVRLSCAAGITNHQLELGSTRTGYAPFTVGLIAVPLYDGTLRSLPDGTKDTLALSYLRPSTREGWAWYSRELVQRVGVTTLDGSKTWNSGGSSYDGNVGTDRFVNIAGMRNTGNSNSLLSEELRHSGGYIWSNPDVNIWKCTRFNGQAHVVFDNATVGITSEATDINRTALIKAWLSEHPITMHYPLATPITTQLDPIELPVLPSKHVTVWSDPTANLKLTYVIDSETIEESLESGIGKAFSSVAPVETSPATDSHGVGSRIVYNETLYKVTSAIAAGEDIVPGTNVTATTVAAELLATQA